jgi:hypothetical protein
MPKRLNDQVEVRTAVAASGGASLVELAATKIDATGFSRARFIFNFGNGGATTGSLSTGLGVWQAATSGATFARIAGASAVAVTSGAISGLSPVVVIDVPTVADTPWLQLSGSLPLSNVPHAGVVELYDGVNRPPSSGAQQLVTV